MTTAGSVMEDRRFVLLIGGPDAGKSNYLFRCWLAIDQAHGILVSDGLPDDLEYLRTGADALLNGRFAPRTPTEVHNRNVVPVKASQNGNLKGDLIVPDCSGEKWLDIYDRREWSDDWEELISPGTGCLVFIRAGSDKIVAPLDWINCFKLFGSAEMPDAGLESEADVAAGQSAKRTAPTQIVLIDWLQFLRRVFTDRIRGSFRPRIGIVVSAWDAVPEDEKPAGPIAYLAANFPMFEQFLRANSSFFDIQTFAVSVAGGDFMNEPGFRDKFLEGNPLTAGFVIHGLDGDWKTTTDHTLPVAWALGLIDQTDRSER